MAAYAALVSLMHIIENLRLHPRPPITLEKEHVESLTAKVSFLLEFLEGYDPHVSYTDEADPLESRIAEAAHAAEDVIELYIVNQILDQEISLKDVLKGPEGTNMHESVEKAIEGMALVEKECMGIKQTTPPDSTFSASSSSSAQPMVQKKTVMVGADDALLELKSMLISDARDLQVIPIVGMGGTGKTTLALNIYQDRLVKEHFGFCAWATVSQKNSIKQILMQLLTLLNADQHRSEGELGTILHNHIYSRRYLIIFDDMESIHVWDKIKKNFPNNKDGSRVVVTTRLSNLASHLSSSKSLEMKLLDEADSWDFLSKTVFREKSCPPKLEEIGKKISLCCKGLPLSITVVGGLLAKSKHTREFWEYVKGYLNSVVNLEDDERCLKILHMSYKQLPVHLKPCFLYMGVFPENEVIYISRVVKLWVAEGFLKPISGKSLEEVVRMYVKDLADRNLILIDKIGRSGNIKRCRIHALLRDLSLREAEKQRFYTLVGRTPGPQGIVCRHIVMPRNTPADEAAAAMSSSMSSLTRSLTWHDCGATASLVQPQQSMSLLRVLDSRMVSPRHGLRRLVNSRFLDVSSDKRYPFPSSIWRFWNLQTLVVRAYGDDATIPSDIWYMLHIRSVQFINGISIANPPPDGVVLGNLHTLEVIEDFKCSEQVVKRIPNIKKLSIRYEEGMDDDGRYSLNNLECLDKLESLQCYFRKGMDFKCINFPHSLKKLNLQVDKKVYSWGKGVLDKIGSLPLLESFTLYWWSFEGGKWETTEGQFRSLKFLSLNYCEGLNVWTTESSHFPRLEQLRLAYLNHQVKEIPLDFAKVSTLRAIYVQCCSDSVVVSVKRILEEREEFYGKEGAPLHVQVNLFRGREELRLRLASPNFHFIRDFSRW